MSDVKNLSHTEEHLNVIKVYQNIDYLKQQHMPGQNIQFRGMLTPTENSQSLFTCYLNAASFRCSSK